MGNKGYYKKKLGVISRIEISQIKTPHHIPVAVYIQEASDLYKWVQEDKEVLTRFGLSWELVEDLPIRCRALVEAEALWQNQRNKKSESSLEWGNRLPLAYDLRKRLLTDFRFAFRKHPDLVVKVMDIAKRGRRTKMIQDLNDLSVLGKANTRLLEVIHFDISLLDKAAQTSGEMAGLLSGVTRDREVRSSAGIIRDQAYTHLKEAVDEIREIGKHVFRKDKDRLKGYISKHIREIKSKQKRKLKKKAAAKKEASPS